ncbi:MAG: transposase [Victivallales bacterium]|nr:transposase [Victivallales bacterium]
MPQSFCQLYAHLVFSTKGRRTWIDDAIRPAMHAYISGALHHLGCADILVGGTADHVHVLCAMAKTVSAVEMVQKTKQSSSRHLKPLGTTYRDFSWQRGHALFAVSPTAVPSARAYIENQAEHHRHVSFQDEFLAILRRAGAQWDDRYVWD